MPYPVHGLQYSRPSAIYTTSVEYDLFASSVENNSLQKFISQQMAYAV
jgi:hypothetical protein